MCQWRRDSLSSFPEVWEEDCGVRYCCLACAWRTPEFCHFTALEATAEGIIEIRDVCLCVARGIVVIVFEVSKCV